MPHDHCTRSLPRDQCHLLTPRSLPRDHSIALIDASQRPIRLRSRSTALNHEQRQRCFQAHALLIDNSLSTSDLLQLHLHSHELAQLFEFGPRESTRAFAHAHIDPQKASPQRMTASNSQQSRCPYSRARHIAGFSLSHKRSTD